MTFYNILFSYVRADQQLIYLWFSKNKIVIQKLYHYFSYWVKKKKFSFYLSSFQLLCDIIYESVVIKMYKKCEETSKNYCLNRRREEKSVRISYIYCIKNIYQNSKRTKHTVSNEKKLVISKYKNFLIIFFKSKKQNLHPPVNNFCYFFFSLYCY